ncbi:dynamin family protein [Georgenia muralis]|uniref:Dynamin family protein n=1 Tax=Georgenia muralis TaxID=154117 RepID=A0A3N4ZJZ4_9MICO|nr:dynamin family protein [Georgenia muralis]RPF25952.1 dynamin family protein [Georgenia muralis]
MSAATLAAARALVADALDVLGDDAADRAALTGLARRLDEPLRIAVAGMVKAGKSTLINAVVGEEIAPTDAGECTRVVTWYRYGAAPSVTLVPVGGGPSRALPVRREDGRLRLDLGTPPEEVERLVVEWPARALRDLVLIDTPGTSSLSTEVSARTATALTPEDVPAEADAVVYLMRHLRAADTAFLEAFRDAAGGGANAVAVLSRADEIGAGRLDALVSARDIASRAREDPALRELAVAVVPVAGLLAQSARTLRQAEFDALSALAALERAHTERLLVSVDRFATAEAPVDAAERAALLDRFGVFGIRLALVLLRGGVAQPTRLAGELARRSGLGELVRVVEDHFQARAEDLKARTAVVALERMLRARPRAGTDGLERALERFRAGAHELEELRLLARARTGGLGLPAGVEADAVRVLGGRGATAAERLGMEPAAPVGAMRAAALDELRRWRSLAASPFSDRATAQVCENVARSCEGVLAELAEEAATASWLALGTGPGQEGDGERQAG